MDQILSLFISLLAVGLMMGLIYTLYSIGLTLIYGVMRIVNFAHGQFYMLGGYALYYATLYLNIPSIVALPLAAMVGFVFAYFFERATIRPIYKGKIANPGNYSNILTFSLVILLPNLAIVLFGPWNYGPASFWPITIRYGFMGIEGDRIVGAFISVVLIVAMQFFLKKTWLGKAFEATSQNLQGAQIQGINPDRISALSFGISGALAAATGALLGPLYLVYPNSGAVPGMKAFIINVFGGLGSIPGCIVGGLAVGITETLLAVYISPAYKDLYAFLLLAIVLVVKPYGLFGKPEETRK